MAIRHQQPTSAKTVILAYVVVRYLNKQESIYLFRLCGQLRPTSINESPCHLYVQQRPASAQEGTLPLGVWEGLRFVIVALPGLFSYFFFVTYVVVKSPDQQESTFITYADNYGPQQENEHDVRVDNKNTHYLCRQKVPHQRGKDLVADTGNKGLPRQ